MSVDSQEGARRTRPNQGARAMPTNGDAAFWGDTLQLQRAIAGSKHGGIGPSVSPKPA